MAFGMFPVTPFLVGGGNPIPLRLTGPIAQFIRLCTVVNREAGFKRAGRENAQVCVSHRKIRVEFDGPFEERNRRFRPFCAGSLNAGAVSFQRSSEGVVAFSKGVSNFCIVLKDSPSLFRISTDTLPSASEHMVLVRLPALPCSPALPRSRS